MSCIFDESGTSLDKLQAYRIASAIPRRWAAIKGAKANASCVLSSLRGGDNGTGGRTMYAVQVVGLAVTTKVRVYGTIDGSTWVQVVEISADGISQISGLYFDLRVAVETYAGSGADGISVTVFGK